MTRSVQVRVNRDLTLNAGLMIDYPFSDGTVPLIIPPTVSMFEQLVIWLELCPNVTHDHLTAVDLAQATVSVCLRWGSLLAVMMDPALPKGSFEYDECRMRTMEHGRVTREVSAALHFWYAIHRRSPVRYRHLASRALRFLPPMPKPLRSLNPDGALAQFEARGGLEEYCQRKLADSLDCLLREPADDATYRARFTPVHLGPPFDDAYTNPMRERTNALVEHIWVRDNLGSIQATSTYTGDCLVRRFSKPETTVQLRRAVTRLATLQYLAQRDE